MCKIYLTPEIAQRVRDTVGESTYVAQVVYSSTLLLSVIVLTIQADDVVKKLTKLRTYDNWDYIDLPKVQILSSFGLMFLYMLLVVNVLLITMPIIDALFSPFPKHGKLRSESDTSSSLEEEEEERGNV